MKESYEGNDQSMIINLEQDISIINNSYIGFKGRRDEGRKLILGKKRDGYFYNNVQFRKNEIYKLNRHSNTTEKNVRGAIIFFRMNFKNNIKNTSFEETYDYLDNLSNIVTDDIQISNIETDDQTQAFCYI